MKHNNKEKEKTNTHGYYTKIYSKKCRRTSKKQLTKAKHKGFVLVMKEIQNKVRRHPIIPTINCQGKQTYHYNDYPV